MLRDLQVVFDERQRGGRDRFQGGVGSLGLNLVHRRVQLLMGPRLRTASIGTIKVRSRLSS